MVQDEIYYLSMDNLLDRHLLNLGIYPNTHFHLYWSDDWSEDFYIESAYAGFISTSLNMDGSVILLPEIQPHYAILEWADVILSKKVKKLLHSQSFLNNEFYVRFNGPLDPVIQRICHYHKDNWLCDQYAELLNQLVHYHHKKRDFHIVTVELCSQTDNQVIAGEIGYAIGATYTSLTGFCDRENKKYNHFGTFQLVLLAKTLQYHGYHFWNLGHPHMQYKVAFGARIIEREHFLEKWLYARDQHPSKKLVSQCQLDAQFFKELF